MTDAISPVDAKLAEVDREAELEARFEPIQRSDRPAPDAPSVNERFEAEAEAFQQATGYMAPGKDVPLAMSPTDDWERERQIAWKAWSRARAKNADERRIARQSGVVEFAV